SGKIDRKALSESELTLALQADNTIARDVFELQLISIWETVLNQNALSIHDNFFELGGHSLLALKLMSQIQQQFNIQMPVSSLFQNPTIASLAKQLRDGKTDTSPHLVPIRATGNRNTIFLVPEATGSVMYLHPLASNLDNEYPVYALSTPGLNGSAIINDVKKLASFHVENLRQQQPKGPYILAGHSSGGRVAYEIAWQLEQQGETIELLAILDTYAPNSPPEHDDMAMYNDYNWLHDIVYAFETTNQTNLNLSVQDLEAFGNLESAYEHVMDVFQQHDLFASNTDIEKLKALVNVYRVSCQIDFTYKMPGKLHCPIHLFCATEMTENHNESLEPDFVTRGWTECTDGEVFEYQVPGNHMSMMFSP
ncbi:thioesterase domain-containing protein, partial [Candidatus Marithioploca araucensis]|nr:thioesterase domain-containing protein [Candidatus Marithioploca araucensis]